MKKILFQEEDKVVKVAMEIVLAAGDARNKAGKALDCVEAFDFDEARKYLEEARKDILKAHNAQTNMIQAEISGEETMPPSLLFNHAQDTLMTIMTEVNLTEKMIKLFEKFYKKMEGKI